LDTALDDVWIHTAAPPDHLHCFLLKEAAINFIMANAKEVLLSGSINNIPERKTIMRDIIRSVAMTQQRKEDLSQLSINELRAELESEGKDFDGSREMLIARLQEGKSFQPAGYIFSKKG
jgi:hypothetical protein